MKIINGLIAGVLAVSLTGCWGKEPEPRPLTAQAAIQSDIRADQTRAQRADNPGLLRTNDPSVPRPVQPTDTSSPRSPAVADAVRSQVRTPAEDAQRQSGVQGIPATQPATRVAAGTSQGSFQLLGAVITTVNGEPIFANKVLRDIEPVLAAKAREMDANQFRRSARDEIERQTYVMIRDKLEFARAQRTLSGEDQRLARFLTERWRDQRITEAGGSLEMARQRARADGMDFDEMIEERYRLHMRQIYFSKKEFPRIQITAADMRNYYEKNLNTAFTDREELSFRVIKVAIRNLGSREAALARANEVRERAIKGEDFAQLAADFNNDPFFARNRGAVTPDGTALSKGSFRVRAVEDAAWATPVNEVTSVIEADEAFWIAKVEAKKSGRAKGFEEEAVQNQIRKALEAEQFALLRERDGQRLLSQAIVSPMPPDYSQALDMAMQLYSTWRAGK